MLLSFNSIKVRLELDSENYFLFTDEEFQFHKGAIRTEVELDLMPSHIEVSIP